MNDRELAYMVKDCTAHALLFLNTHREEYLLATKAIEDQKLTRDKRAVLEAWAYAHADDNNDEFGELFEPELVLVDWFKVVKGL